MGYSQANSISTLVPLKQGSAGITITNQQVSVSLVNKCQCHWSASVSVANNQEGVTGQHVSVNGDQMSVTSQQVSVSLVSICQCQVVSKCQCHWSPSLVNKCQCHWSASFRATGQQVSVSMVSKCQCHWSADNDYFWRNVLKHQ